VHPKRFWSWLSGTENSSSRATWWRPGALIGAVVCLHAAPQVQLFAIAGNGYIMRYGIISSSW